ncbi:MAG: S49 family peptidase [Planctomycetaceae bacterium]
MTGRQTLDIYPQALAWLRSSDALESELRPSIESWLILARQHQKASNIQVSDGDRYCPLPRRIMVGDVAVLPIVGMMERKPSYITAYGFGISTEQIESELIACLGDSRVKSIVFFVDSPGGDAMGNEELFNRIFAARGTKPISAFVRGYCCSAAYYISSATSKIVTTPSSVVGSIGTMMVHQDYSKMLEDYGVKATLITYGENKGFGNPYEPLSENSRKLLQQLINDHGQQFANAVARGRGVSVETVLAKYGQGNVFLAKESLSIGLIDGIAVWDQFMANLPGTTPSNVEDRTTLAASPSSASSTPGGVQPVQTHSASSSGAEAPIASTTEESVMWKRIKAALFAQGLIESMDVSDEVAKGVVQGICAGRGTAMPSDEAQVLALVQSPIGATVATATAPLAATQPTAAPASNVTDAHNREQAEARAQAATVAERNRITDLTARGRMMNLSQAQIDAAVNGNMTVDAALRMWTDTQAASNPGVSTPTQVNVIGHGSAALQVDACNALLMRQNRSNLIPANQMNDNVRRLSNAPLSELARQFLRSANHVVVDEYDREEIIHQALSMDSGRQVIRAEGGGSYTRQGSLPNLFAAYANRVLDNAITLANPTYTQWAGRWGTDLGDFKAVSIINKNNVDELDEVLDAEEFKQAFVSEEVLSQLQLSRYGNVFNWTPIMIANDDLGGLDEALLGFGIGHENTLNRLCVRLLAGNVTLLDTYSLFDQTNHKNDITSGAGAGAPSDAQWELMENNMATQNGVGGRGYVRSGMNICLIPPQLKRKARQTFVYSEDKTANTDSNINVYRGDVEPIVEPELQAYSTTQWYGLVKPIGSLNATVIYTFFNGYGAGGRRERWYDPNNKCYKLSLEGRFGAAVKQFRYVQRNAGA